MAAALPNMFSLGGLFGGNLATAAAAAAASNSALATASGNTNGTMEGEGNKTALTKREAEEKEEGEDCDEAGEEEEEEAEGNEEKVKKAKKKKMEKSNNDVTAAPQTPAADSPADSSINGDATALLAAAGMSANSLAFNPFLLSTMAPGLLYPSMFLPPGLAGLSLPGFPTASTLAELQSAMAGALGGNAVNTNPPRDEEKTGLKATGGEEEDEEEEEEEEAQGGESDLAEEKEGGAEETKGDAEDSALEDGGMGGEEEEEEDTSPQKDKSD